MKDLIAILEQCRTVSNFPSRLSPYEPILKKVNFFFGGGGPEGRERESSVSAGLTPKGQSIYLSNCTERTINESNWGRLGELWNAGSDLCKRSAEVRREARTLCFNYIYNTISRQSNKLMAMFPFCRAN